jgi:hypothetical protein
MRLDMFVAVFVSTHMSPFGKPRRCSAIPNAPRSNAPTTKTAAAIKEKLDGLHKELCRFLNGALTKGATASKKCTMSAAARRKIAAAQRARWAKA